MDCRGALIDTDGNIEKALDLLKEKGLLKAQKKAERTTSQGLVEAYIHTAGRIGAMIEINCETDFVARTDEFKALAHCLAMQVAASNPPYLSEADIPAEEKEREFEIFRQQVKDKPEAIQEKILIGKWRKRLTELCLLNLPFLHDDKISVGEYLKKQADPGGEPIEIKGFICWQLGVE